MQWGRVENLIKQYYKKILEFIKKCVVDELVIVRAWKIFELVESNFGRLQCYSDVIQLTKY